MRIRRRLAADLDTVLSRFDCVAAPSTGVVASPLTMSFDDYAGPVRRLMLGAAANLAGLPGVSLPNGFGERGLPTGLQLVGRVGDENAILAVARAFQGRSDWHRRQPNL
jgi:aspartyl-tRNA(Asn)/glutamyl-tRNA(Gln) amidotransferase subunit A